MADDDQPGGSGDPGAEYGPTVRPGCEVSASVWNAFVADVKRRKGYARGQLGPQLENAIRAYLRAGEGGDVHDRLARIEGMLADLHEDGVHTQSGHEVEELPKNMAVDKKARRVIEALRRENDNVFRTSELEDVIRQMVGGDPRTIRSQREAIKNDRLAFEHPFSGLWFFDETTFFGNIHGVEFIPEREREAIRRKDGVTWERYTARHGYPTETLEQVREAYGYTPEEWSERREAARLDDESVSASADIDPDVEGDLDALSQATPEAVADGGTD